MPQVVNAVLSKHNFILLGLRGQAKTRLLRALVELLDAEIPVVPGCEIHDDPLNPLCAACRAQVAVEGDDLPVAWLGRERRYVEKLATPDVTIADLIGDVDPIKAARAGRELSDELVMHYGLLPRANRGLFAVNELPDLASKVQVGLFNILQEGDVQIKGFPVRLRLDVALMFSANPEDYTARGKIITPLKDRIGSEIRTHYPRTRDEAMAITTQEAWTARDGRGGTKLPVGGPGVRPRDRRRDRVPGARRSEGRSPVRRQPAAADHGARNRRCPTPSGARWWPARRLVVPRVSDIYAALPSITGKIELEYEGELKGAEHVARELIRASVASVFDARASRLNTKPIVTWFENGGTIDLSDTMSSDALLDAVGGIDRFDEALGLVDGTGFDAPLRAAAADFILEGLCALRKISRTEGGQLFASPPAPRRPRPRPEARSLEQLMEDDEDEPRGRKKKYFN